MVNCPKFDSHSSYGISQCKCNAGEGDDQPGLLMAEGVLVSLQVPPAHYELQHVEVEGCVRWLLAARDFSGEYHQLLVCNRTIPNHPSRAEISWMSGWRRQDGLPGHQPIKQSTKSCANQEPTNRNPEYSSTDRDHFGSLIFLCSAVECQGNRAAIQSRRTQFPRHFHTQFATYRVSRAR